MNLFLFFFFTIKYLSIIGFGEKLFDILILFDLIGFFYDGVGGRLINGWWLLF
jgi:hypothetical protein